MITLFVKGTPGQFFGKFIVLYSIKSKTRKEFNYDSMLNEKVLHKHTKINMLVFTKVYR